MHNRFLVGCVTMGLTAMIILLFPSDNTAGSTHCFGQAAVVDTNQTTNYSANDDSAYQPAFTQHSYTDNGDGTITDNRTGLMWKKCSEPNTTTTCGSESSYTWSAAISQCEGLTYPAGGYTDWRLPNVNELASILDLEPTLPAPYINGTYFPSFANSSYWSSTTYPAATTDAMTVRFYAGYTYHNLKTDSNYVVCVRAGP